MGATGTEGTEPPLVILGKARCCDDDGGMA